MEIKVLFFGATADLVGTRSKGFDIGTPSSVERLVNEIVSLHSELRRHKLLFSVNQEYVSADALLSDGDEVAIFTAVSGG